MASGSSWRGKSSGSGNARQRRGRYKLSILNANIFKASAQEAGMNMFRSGNYRGANTLGDALVRARRRRKIR